MPLENMSELLRSRLYKILDIPLSVILEGEENYEIAFNKFMIDRWKIIQVLNNPESTEVDYGYVLKHLHKFPKYAELTNATKTDD